MGKSLIRPDATQRRGELGCEVRIGSGVEPAGEDGHRLGGMPPPDDLRCPAGREGFGVIQRHDELLVEARLVQLGEVS
jgi:hypothetical protein